MIINKSKASIFAATFVFLLSPSIGFSASVEERLKALEQEAEVTRAENEDMAAKLKNSMTVSGYADTEYITSTKPGDKEGFRLHHFSVFLKKQINEDLRFFSETEYEDGPFHDAGNGEGAIFVEAVNFDYQWRPDTSLRVGRFFTPAGIWSVDHYPPFVLTQDRPMHIREIFPQLVDGAAVSGHHAMGSSFFNYDLYVGNGEQSNFYGKGDYNSTTAAGLKVNFAFPIAQLFEVGGTLYHDKLESTFDGTESEKDVQGVHAKIRQGAFGFQGEYADGKYKPTVSPATNLPFHKKGYYAQFSYDINKWTLGYRYDYFDPNTTTAVSSGSKINSAILNYHVDKNVVLKWEHHLGKPDDPAQKSYFRDIVSVVVNLD